LITKQINGYISDFIDLQSKQAAHKVTEMVKAKTGLKEVPGIITADAIKELNYRIREGVDKVKFDLLLKASMKENSLSSKEKETVVASIKRAYDFVLSHHDRLLTKAPQHIRLFCQFLLLANVPCSNKHFQAIVAIIERMVEPLGDLKNECIEAILDLKEFSTHLVQEAIEDVKAQVVQNIAP